MPRIHIGTSGWNYESFRGVLYGRDLPKARFFKEYTRHFKTVELNASFYRSFPDTTWLKWYEKSPPGFIWSVKVHRYITHVRRLQVEKDSIERFFGSVSILREKAGPVLFQLPPGLPFDQKVFRDLLDLLSLHSRGIRVAFEARHPSWHRKEVLELFRSSSIGWVIGHTGGRYPMTVDSTTDFSYLRLHGPERLYSGTYGEERLRRWLEVVLDLGKEAFVYFDNTDDGSAARDALLFDAMATATAPAA